MNGVSIAKPLLQRSEFKLWLSLGKSPSEAEIIFAPISNVGRMPGRTTSGLLLEHIFDAIGERYLPKHEELDDGFLIHEISERNTIAYVVTVDGYGSEKTIYLLQNNLRSALNHVWSHKRESTIWLPLMGTGVGALPLEKSLGITLDVIYESTFGADNFSANIYIDIPANIQESQVMSLSASAHERVSKHWSRAETDELSSSLPISASRERVSEMVLSPRARPKSDILSELLTSLFGYEELRRFVYYTFGKTIYHSLPGPSSSLSELVFSVVQQIENHGLLDGQFFASLEKMRTGQSSHIRAVAHQILGESNRPLHYRPNYPDQRTQHLSTRLEQAYRRRNALQRNGADAAKVLREIIGLKRELREGGRLKEGDQLDNGRYLLIEQIGYGGFAVVWKAFDQSVNELIAIKVLHTNVAGDELRRDRFFRGARIMARLMSDAVVRILDPYGEDGGYYYFTMELINGGNLHDAIVNGVISPTQAQPMITILSHTLSNAHRQGIFHRDIKPQNILLVSAEKPKLTDFDLVAAPDTTGGTHTGALGTFLYSAPEMLDRPQDADARADVYSIAMTALFILHGKALPYTVLRGNIEKFIDSFSIDKDFATVLKKATDVSPENRFSDAEELHLALVGSAGVKSTRRHIELVEIPSGQFELGSSPIDEMTLDRETPSHIVKIGRFMCSQYAVTRHIWLVVMGRPPLRGWWPKGSADERPVTNVNWFEAVEFCNRLSIRDGLEPCYEIQVEQVRWELNSGYRLLTEAEWEYACRAGTRDRWWFGNDEGQLKQYAWYANNSESVLHPVGKKPANPWGLHDMHGNVWEWCWDWFTRYEQSSQKRDGTPQSISGGLGRVLRGGSFNSSAQELRSSSRVRTQPELSIRNYGFRCARDAR